MRWRTSAGAKAASRKAKALSLDGLSCICGTRPRFSHESSEQEHKQKYSAEQGEVVRLSESNSSASISARDPGVLSTDLPRPSYKYNLARISYVGNNNPMSTKMDSLLDKSTLDPLPPVLQRGLIAVSSCGLLSFFASLTLLLYLTFKLFNWWRKGDLENGCNQFLLLIYNLALADLQQSVAFLLTAVWLGENKIDATSSTCFAEGWFVSTGDLASGVWVLAIAVHTFYAVVKGRRLHTITFLVIVAGLWTFIYAMACIGIAMHPHDYYIRASAWCWVNEAYSRERLWLHYIWIFFCMFGTITIYLAIFIILRSRVIVQDSNSIIAPLSSRGRDRKVLQRAGRYMIFYPLIYTLCTLPLAAGRMAAMSGVKISYAYFCVAGASITSCGWLDVLMYAFTRRALIFSNKAPAPEDLGASTFGVFDSSTSMFTTIEGGIKLRGYTRSRSPAPSPQQDDLFVTPIAGVITTKTTIEITSRPVRRDHHQYQDQEPITGGSSANSRFGTGNSSELSRLPSLADSWQDNGDSASQKRIY